MSSLFTKPTLPPVNVPPPPPTERDAAVQARASAERTARPGRASQFFSDPQANREAGPSLRRYLGGV
jgi:hypothetical protein